MHRRTRSFPFALAACTASLLSLHSASAQGVNVLTFHGSLDRLGWNDKEQTLSPAHVNTREFGKVWETALDGQVYAAPLYVSGLKVGGTPHDAVFAVTENNSVYALDAATGQPLWKHEALAPSIGEAQYNDCNNIHPLHGITSTPAIDLKTNTIYVSGITQPSLEQVYRVWALDLQTGDVKPGWPVTLRGEYKGCRFDGGQLTQRGALALVNDWLYIPFSSRCDIGEWHGWLMAVNTKDPSQAPRAFSPAPTATGGGIWGSSGVTADGDGHVYVVTGNGKYDLDKKGDNVCESVLRLTMGGDSLRFSGDSKDYYVPSNFQELDDSDQDMGGSGAILLPDLPGSSTPHLIVTCGKDGFVYVVNRDKLGGLGGEIQKTLLFGDPQQTYRSNIKTTPAYFDGGAAGRFVYVCGNETGPGKQAGVAALKLGTDGAAGKAKLSLAWTLPKEMVQPGAPIVSSNGARDAIIWVIESNKNDGDLGPPGVLYALDAVSGAPLYRSNENAARDVLTDARKFSCPTVANGRVFVGTHGVVAYGLLAQKGAKR